MCAANGAFMRDDGKDQHFIKRAAQLAHAHMESGAGGPFGARTYAE